MWGTAPSWPLRTRVPDADLSRAPLPRLLWVCSRDPTRFEEKKLRGALRSHPDKSVHQMSLLFVPLPLERFRGTTWGGEKPIFLTIS